MDLLGQERIQQPRLNLACSIFECVEAQERASAALVIGEDPRTDSFRMFIQFVHKRLSEITQRIFEMACLLAPAAIVEFIPEKIGNLLRTFFEKRANDRNAFGDGLRHLNSDLTPKRFFRLLAVLPKFAQRLLVEFKGFFESAPHFQALRERLHDLYGSRLPFIDIGKSRRGFFFVRAHDFLELVQKRRFADAALAVEANDVVMRDLRLDKLLLHELDLVHAADENGVSADLLSSRRFLTADIDDKRHD